MNNQQQSKSKEEKMFQQKRGELMRKSAFVGAKDRFDELSSSTIDRFHSLVFI